MARRSLAAAAAAGAAALLAGCSPAAILNLAVPRGGYRLVGDEPYGPNPRQRLDAYAPATAVGRPGPLVVFIYGGSWRRGERGTYRFVGQALASRGYATVIPDYRLFPEVRFPSFLEDCAAAVAWARAHADRIGADPGRLHLMGHSAGAYNAAMLALDGRWLGAHGLDPRRDVRGLVGLSGPYDFYPFTGEDTREVMAPAADPLQTQPITFADGHGPPMLLATGLDDDIVRPRNTLSLAARTRERGGRVEVRTYPGVGHIGTVAALAAPLQWRNRALIGDVTTFLASTGG